MSETSAKPFFVEPLAIVLLAMLHFKGTVHAKYIIATL